MSQYPPYMHGQYGGAAHSQYTYQAPITYTSSTGFPPAPSPHEHQQQHYAVAQSSYDYNANNIPGLGMGGANPHPVQSPSSFVTSTTNPAWVQPPPPPPVSHNQQHEQQQPSYSQPIDLSSTSVPYSSMPPRPATPPAQLQTSVLVPASSYPTVPTEGAELSEGEFEDLYEPHDPEKERGRRQDQDGKRKEVDQSRGARQATSGFGAQPEVVSARDSNEDSLYGSGSEAGEVAIASQPGHLSLSTGLPKETPRTHPPDAPPSPTQNVYPPLNRVGPLHLAQPAGNTATKTSSGSRQILETASNAVNIPGFGAPPNQVSQPPTQSATRSVQPLSNIQSTTSVHHSPLVYQDQKNKAKEAILRLWPSIKYQVFVQEGFDPALTKLLFDELGLDSSSHVLPAPKNDKKANPESKTQPAATTIVNTVASGDEKAEARKERIARLLALKKSKSTTSQPTPEPNPITPSGIPPTDQPSATESGPTTLKTKQASRKDLILQKKLDALEKSRAARAQKDAKRKSSDQAQNSANIHPSSTPGHGSMDNNIPGLSVVSASTSPLPDTILKSGVVSESSSNLPSLQPERPSQPQRGPSSVEASENEDVEMDMDSPAEYNSSNSANRQPTAGSRGSTGGDFFGSVASAKQQESTTPLSGTPPLSGITTPKNVQCDLKRKAREIEDLKKRIAEAEARKAAHGKPLRGSTVGFFPAMSGFDAQVDKIPQASSPRLETRGLDIPEERGGPEDSSPQAATKSPERIQPPKRSDPSEKSLNSQRRERIVSIQLPRLETSVQEKMKRVKLLEHELATLRAELRDNLKEKQRLTEEVNFLDSELNEGGRVNGVNSDATHEARSNSPASTHLPEGKYLAAAYGQSVSRSDSPLGQAHQSPHDSNAVNRASAQREMHIAPILSAVQVQNVPRTISAIAPTTASGESVRNVENQTGPSPDAVNCGDLPNTAVSPERRPDSQASATAGVDVGEDVEMRDVPLADNGSTNESLRRITHENASSGLASQAPFGSAYIQEISDVEVNTYEGSCMPQQISAGGPEARSEEGNPGHEVTTVEGTVPHDVTQQPASRFSPYESPLAMFKAFRFHPDFNRAVHGGLKSLTYSNKIDPKREFCTTELLEGSCDEPSCQFQHLSSVVAPEDFILLELGASADYSGERKSKFTQGLRTLLTDLKSRRVRNFEELANEIIAYRTRFAGDPSKILPLDGVDI